MPLYASAEYVNASKGYRMGSDGIQETFTDNPGKLYRHCVREYGRCVSKVYVDTPTGKPRPIGWVFVKRCEYSDARPSDRDRTYLQETWVTLHDAPDTVTREAHYHTLG